MRSIACNWGERTGLRADRRRTVLRQDHCRRDRAGRLAFAPARHCPWCAVAAAVYPADEPPLEQLAEAHADVAGGDAEAVHDIVAGQRPAGDEQEAVDLGRRGSDATRSSTESIDRPLIRSHINPPVAPRRVLACQAHLAKR